MGLHSLAKYSFEREKSFEWIGSYPTWLKGFKVLLLGFSIPLFVLFHFYKIAIKLLILLKIKNLSKFKLPWTSRAWAFYRFFSTNLSPSLFPKVQPQLSNNLNKHFYINYFNKLTIY